jgi:outer membrane scaffolding protein for murein synthesis (MipA/OmpV family)
MLYCRKVSFRTAINFLAALAALLPIPALAQDTDQLGTLLGLGVRSRPEYDGAAKQELEPIPVIRYYGRTLFARTTQGVLEGGARAELIKGLFAGVQLAYEGGNDRTDVDPGASYGVHMEWDFKLGPAPAGLLVRTRFHFDSDLGSQTDLRGTLGVYGGGGLALWVFGQATWGSDKWVQSYYTAGEGGLLYTAFGIEGGYDLSRHWLLLGSVHARWLQDDAKRSPITEEKTNYYASVGIAYRF